MSPDYLVTNEGSIFLFYPQNDAALAHLRECTDGQWFGGALACEHRYAYDLAQGLQSEGYTVK